MKRTLNILITLLVSLLAVDCSSKNSNENSKIGAELILQEIHPENEGRISPEAISLKNWSWNLDLEIGDRMEIGKHYEFNGNLPDGLTMEIVLLSRNSAEVRLIGNAVDHHVSMSVRNLPLKFLEDAFLASSKKALREEIVNYALGIQFGKGYQISGTSIGTTQGVQLKLANIDEVINLDNQQSTFQFRHLLENGDKYEIQALSSPQGKCCRFENGIGIINSQNVSDIILTCTAPSWVDPLDESDFFQKENFDEYTRVDLHPISYDQGRNVEILWTSQDYSELYSSIHKSQHGGVQSFVPSDEIYESNQGITNYKKASHPNGFSVLAFNENNAETGLSKFYVQTFDQYREIPRDDLKLLLQTTNNVRVEVHVFDDYRALIIFADLTDRKLSYSYYNGEEWSNRQDFTPLGDLGSISFKSDFNSQGFGVVVAQYTGINSRKKLYRMVFDFDYFKTPESIHIPISGTDYYHVTNTFLSLISISSFDVAVDQTGKAFVYWFQVPTGNPNDTDNYLMVSNYESNIWDDPTTLSDRKFEVDGPQQSILQTDGLGNAKLLIISDYHEGDVNGYLGLDLLERSMGTWANEGALYSSINPFQNLENIAPSVVYSRFPFIGIKSDRTVIAINAKSYSSNIKSHLFFVEQVESTWKLPEDLFERSITSEQLGYSTIVDGILRENGSIMMIWEQKDLQGENAYTSLNRLNRPNADLPFDNIDNVSLIHRDLDHEYLIDANQCGAALHIWRARDPEDEDILNSFRQYVSDFH
jgi:hypothetical protein